MDGSSWLADGFVLGFACFGVCSLKFGWMSYYMSKIVTFYWIVCAHALLLLKMVCDLSISTRFICEEGF
jgi:hypothetical protein